MVHKVHRLSSRVCALGTAMTVLILSLFGGVASASSVPFEHPSFVLNKTDLAIAKQRIADNDNEHPQKANYTRLINQANAALNFTPDPPAALDAYNDLDNARNYMRGSANPAYTLALAYLYTDNAADKIKYANKSISILKAWADKGTIFYGGPAGIHTGASFAGMLYAADILHDYAGWSTQDRKDFENYWRTRILPLNLQVARGPQHFSNWGSHAWKAVLAAAIAFEDMALRDEVMEALYDEYNPYNDDYSWHPLWANDPADKYPKFQVITINDVEYPCFVADSRRTKGTAPNYTYQGINYHGFNFSSHSPLKEAARSVGVDFFDELTHYTPADKLGRNLTMREVFEQYFKWQYLGEKVPVHTMFNWSGTTDYMMQSSPNSIEIMLNNYQDTLTPAIKAAMVSWLNTNRPADASGDPHVTLNKGDMPVVKNVTRAPNYRPHGGKFFGTQYVTINSLTPGAVIHYTTDGSEPTTSSPVYSTPIEIAATTTLKARAFGDGMVASMIASEDYIKAMPPVAGQMVGLAEATGSADRLGNFIDAFPFTASSGFMAKKMTVRYADNSNSGGGARMAIYADKNGKPDVLLGTTEPFAAVPGICTADLEFPVEIKAGETYWLAVWLARSITENHSTVLSDFEKAHYVATTNTDGTRYSFKRSYITIDKGGNDSIYTAFPASGASFTASTGPTYAIYATGDDQPGFYVNTALKIAFDEAVADISLLNTFPEGEDKTATAVLGKYDENGKLMDIVTKDYTSIAGGGATGDVLKIMVGQGEYAKLMIWDSMLTMKPLIQPRRVDNLKRNAILTEIDGNMARAYGVLEAGLYTTIKVVLEDEIVYLNQTVCDHEGNFSFNFPVKVAGDYLITVSSQNMTELMTTRLVYQGSDDDNE